MPRVADRSGVLRRLPPLDALRFFEAAARRGSFSAAGRELSVTSAAVAHRVKTLESSLGDRLFERRARGVHLNSRGEAFLKDVQRILTDLRDATERYRNRGDAPYLKIVAVEVVAANWLLPRLPEFKATHPDLVIEVDTDHGEPDPVRREFDVWIAFENETQRALHSETLFDEALIPVCNPVLLEKRAPPRRPGDLRDWPLLYALASESCWAYWFAHVGLPPPDLSRATGLGLHGMVVDAAIGGMGVALGHASMLARELERRTLVSLFDARVAVPARYHVVTAPASRDKPAAQGFRDWLLAQASAMQEHAPSKGLDRHAR